MLNRDLPSAMDPMWQIAPRLALRLTLPDPPKVEIPQVEVGK